jgi:hypothetical protein
MVSEQPEPETGTEAPAAGGVFGNLPGSRPGTRSPRRGSTAAAKGDCGKRAAAAKSKPKAKPSVKPGPRPAPEAKTAPRDAGPAAADEPGGGLEDIAWAGVAAAAEAATLGVRLASRAIEALRGNSERS